MNDCVRVGKVSSIDYQKGYLQVTYPDRNDIVSKSLPCLNFSENYKMPKIGDMVLVNLLPNSQSDGVVIGKFFTDENVPVEFGENIFYKKLDDEGSHIKYDSNTGTLYIKVKNIVIETDKDINITSKNKISLSGTALESITSDIQVLLGKKIVLIGENESTTIN